MCCDMELSSHVFCTSKLVVVVVYCTFSPHSSSAAWKIIPMGFTTASINIDNYRGQGTRLHTRRWAALLCVVVLAFLQAWWLGGIPRKWWLEIYGIFDVLHSPCPSDAEFSGTLANLLPLVPNLLSLAHYQLLVGCCG